MYKRLVSKFEFTKKMVDISCISRNHVNRMNKLVDISNQYCYIVFDSDQNEREFIDSVVCETQRLMSQIAVRGNPKIESNQDGGFLIPARRLDIAHSDNPEKWMWSSIYDRT